MDQGKVREFSQSGKVGTSDKGQQEMGIQLVHTPGLYSTSLSIYCATQVSHRNGASVYICTYGVDEISCK